MTITTTAGETFSDNDSRALAVLLCRRFGWDTEAAAAAWRRMLGNNCTDTQFAALANAPHAAPTIALELGASLLEMVGFYRREMAGFVPAAQVERASWVLRKAGLL